MCSPFIVALVVSAPCQPVVEAIDRVEFTLGPLGFLRASGAFRRLEFFWYYNKRADEINRRNNSNNNRDDVWIL